MLKPPDNQIQRDLLRFILRDVWWTLYIMFLSREVLQLKDCHFGTFC